MKRIIIENVDLMGQAEEDELLAALKRMNVQFTISKDIITWKGHEGGV